jgi:hypothetical protein
MNLGENRRSQATSAYQNALAQNMQGIQSGYNALTGAQNQMTNQYSQSAQGYGQLAGNMLGSAIGIGVNSAIPYKQADGTMKSAFDKDPLLKWFGGN